MRVESCCDAFCFSSGYCAQLREVLLRPLELLLLMRRRGVAQLAAVAGDSELLDQPERREQLRLLEHELDEDLFVEDIQAPRPEPDGIDDEDRRDQQQQ